MRTFAFKQKSKQLWSIMIALLISGTACSQNDDEIKPAPVFKSSIPENKTSDIDISTVIEVIFDEVVSLASNHGITINETPANVEVSLTKLIFVVELNYETVYEIVIPKGAVINTFNVPLENEMKLSFTTEAEKIVSFDPNFHIYLCFGQSNMEGQGTIYSQDKTVDERFQVLQSLDCTQLGSKGEWRVAVPPLCQCGSGLSPADYFGRTMVANLPDSIKIGVINVAIGGCDIRLFDKDQYQDYTSTYTEDWFVNKIRDYGGNPYNHLIELAKQAQKAGVIKGFLLHQGETNTGDSQWPNYVKTVYTDMLTDLSLNADAVPLLAGEVVHEDQNGVCASMNGIINTLPEVIPSAYVISSSGCTAKSDNVHFDSEGYRELGKRYATTMLSIMGYEDIITE